MSKEEKLGFIGYEEIGHNYSTQNTLIPGKWICVLCGVPLNEEFRPCPRDKWYANEKLIASLEIVV